MNITLINEMGKTLGYARTDLIEKDMLLQQLLQALSSEDFFSKNFIFKGGTCLIRAYTGYFRFSEDIDFTYRNQKEFDGMTNNEVTAVLSKKISKAALILEEVSLKKGLRFRANKSDKNYMEFGGSNRTATFKIWYDSVVLKREAFIKVQINFIEKILF